MDFLRIGEGPHTWDALAADWKRQTESQGAEFDEEYQLTAALLHPLVDRNDRKAGLYAVHDNGAYHAICQINTAGIPGYRQPVMRIRFMTFEPSIDLGGVPPDSYASALVEVFVGVVKLSMTQGPMEAGHVHFHLPSPNDQQFFALVGRNVADRGMFKSVEQKGAWLYITI